jgi:hypothetical protein
VALGLLLCASALLRSKGTPGHSRSPRSAAPALHLPLRQLALCVDCEACFAVGTMACPACSGKTWVLLATFLDHGPRRVVSPFHPLRKSATGGPNPRTNTNGCCAKQILVVARDQQKLYEYARRAFAGNPTVEVVLDRRRTERRRADRSRLPERRRGDRRLTLEVDDHLRTLGWAILRCDGFRLLELPHLSGSR